MRAIRAAAGAVALPLLVAATPPAVTITPAEKAAAKAITPARLLAHTRFLADDLLEGRGPATRGDRLAQAYIATQLEGMGLEPAGPNGSWFQPFDIVGVDSKAPATTLFRKGSDSVQLREHEDFIAGSGVQVAQSRVEDAELVFVGYGIVAPEYGWDDFKGADVKGKVVVVMNNDPEDDPKLFAGRTRLYYGRWTYKYEQAARMGAVAAIIIHTTPSAGYGWQVVQTSWSGEQFSVPAGGEPELQVKAWVTEDSARKLAKLAGKDLDALRTSAQSKDFKAVPLGVTWSVVLENAVGRKQTANVIGRLPGSDPVLSKDAVVYSAHHDHLGVREGATAGKDAIYNGAHDNASGVAAMLAIAEAMKALPRPKRSILFAAVAAEEQGLLGAQYFAAHPTIEPGHLAANINIDGINTVGRTKDITMIGLGKSSLDAWVKGIAAAQGRVVKPDQFPDRGFFYRSDQFALARIGVPAAYFDEGVEVIGKPEGWGKEQKEKFEATDYHQPSDEVKADWDLAGAVEDTQLCFYLGAKVANDPKAPAWNAGDEFEAARKKALADLKR
ncbi:MAG TPA: M28 family metallopeptidase [Vicinamibacteria bacterium]|nr:M28 family metallopeptidase [Vicinamibacteria bacterium]